MVGTKHLFDEIFYKEKVFITGHTGFQGTWLSLWLNSLGAKVTGYSLDPPTRPSLYNIVSLRKDITHIKGDVRDVAHLYESLRASKPKFVFHLAAQSLVRFSYEKPVETFQTNVIGTLNILETIRKIPTVKSCIIMTSDKCYENRDWIYPYRENDPLGGSDPYSASKAAAELVTSAYRRSFFQNTEKHVASIASVRAGNVIGGGDWAKDRIMPDCISSLMRGNVIDVRNPNAIRPWQHVLEPLSGLLLLANKMLDNPIKYSGPWNFGPDLSNSNIAVKDIVSKVITKWGRGKWKTNSKKIKTDYQEANHLRLDSTKATNMLQWHPVYSLDEAISETVTWYKNFSNKNIDMKKLTLKQIESYSKKAKEVNIVWAN